MTSNKFNRNVDIFVTAALMLDWAPSYFFNLNSSIFSGTKIIALPLIIIDILLNSKIYLKWNFAWFFFITFLVGVGGGVVIGNVTFSWFWQLLPICPILLFYQKPRSIKKIRNILRISFLTSLFVPISLLFTYVGFVNPTAEVIGKAGQQYRIAAGTSWSSLGLIIIAISSTLGGILVTKNPPRFNVRIFFLGALILILSIGSLFLTGLKSSIGAFIVTFLIGFFYMPSINRKNKIVFALLIIIILILFRTPLINMFLLNASRYEHLSSNTDSVAIRIEEWHFFLWHLFTKHTFFPIGMENAMKGRWVYAYSHFIIGEAYFFGGLIFMITLIAGFYKAMSRLLKALKKIHEHNSDKSTILALLSYLIGIIIILSFMPGLHTRITYLVLGLSLSIKQSKPIKEKKESIV